MEGVTQPVGDPRIFGTDQGEEALGRKPAVLLPRLLEQHQRALKGRGGLCHVAGVEERDAHVRPRPPFLVLPADGRPPLG